MGTVSAGTAALIGGGIAGGGAILGGLLGSSGAKEAADTQSRAMLKAQRETRAYAEQAKAEILDRMGPAMTQYQQGIKASQTQIANGTADVMQILQQYAGNADQLISSTGANAQKAIMGSAAVARGIPPAQFNSTYDRIQAAPTSVRNSMMSDLSNTLGMTQQSDGTWTATPSVMPSAAGQIGSTGTGFMGGTQDILQGYGTAQRALDIGASTARGDVTGATSAALSQLAATREAGLGAYQPYSEAGRAAIEREAALSGAYGPEAQQQAINAFIESPGQKYLREQQEKALLRNQAAIGGLGGANVRTALQEQAMGIASTQQQQYLENLRSLAMRGQEVAGAETGLTTQTGLYGAQLTAGAGQTLAQLAQQYGISSAQLAQMSSSELSQLAANTGINIANLEQATGVARAGLQTSLGSGLAQAQAGATTDIANLTSQSATNQLNTQQNISTLLSNLATQTGTNVANLTAGQGSALAAGQYLSSQALAGGIGDLSKIAAYYYQPTTQQTLNPITYGYTPYQNTSSQYGVGNAALNTP